MSELNWPVMLSFLYMSMKTWKQQIGSAVSSRLAVFFLSLGPKILTANRIGWFFT